MARTNESLVKAVIDVDDSVWSGVFILLAEPLVDRLAEAESSLTDKELTNIETYLAAHFYALRDPQYQSKRTGKASATFQGRTAKGLDLTWWGQTAKALDPTRSLNSLFDSWAPSKGVHLTNQS